MNAAMRPILAFWAVLAMPMRAADPARAAEMLPSRLYEVTTETGMPHLEENLRYAITRVRRCLVRQRLATAFPILSHPALEGCRLEGETRREDTVSYSLVCAGGHGTRGTARWRVDARGAHGTLDMRLGGKNMTFYQRVTAASLGRCQPRP
jgi:hypothetical protein